MVQRVPKYTIPRVLDGILAENPGGSFDELKGQLLEGHEGGKGIEEVDNSIIDHAREAFEARLNAIAEWMGYHNAPHANEVKERILKYIEKLKPEFRNQLTDGHIALMTLAALRHDDAHIGSTHRQFVIGLEQGSDLSNEEFAVLIFIAEHMDVLSLAAIYYVEGMKLGTSFGQHQYDPVFEALNAEQKAKVKRTPNWAGNMERSLLRLADVGYFENGWEDFKRQSIALWQEKGEVMSFEEWKKKNVGFLNYYVDAVLMEKCKQYFTEDYANELYTKVEECITALNSIGDEERAEIEAQLPKEA